MAKVHRDFYLRDVNEQDWMLKNTWCNLCKKADVGMINPIEYEENGKIFISGNCKICGQEIITEIINEQNK